MNSSSTANIFQKEEKQAPLTPQERIVMEHIKRYNIPSFINVLKEKIDFYFNDSDIKILLMDDDIEFNKRGDLIFQIHYNQEFSKKKDQWIRFNGWYSRWKLHNRLYNICVTMDKDFHIEYGDDREIKYYGK